MSMLLTSTPIFNAPHMMANGNGCAETISSVLEARER
jgi:hypothetical protein